MANIDVDYLKQKMAELDAQRQDLLDNLQAVSGARQLCEHLLAEAQKPEPDVAAGSEAPVPEE